MEIIKKKFQLALFFNGKKMIVFRKRKSTDLKELIKNFSDNKTHFVSLFLIKNKCKGAKKTRKHGPLQTLCKK